MTDAGELLQLPDRQKAAIKALSVLRLDHWQMTKFNVEVIGDRVQVARTYGTDKNPDLYFDIHIIGPRGGVKQKTFRVEA